MPAGGLRRPNPLMPEIELNPEFALALELMGRGEHSLFITGKAGTGKSTLLQYYCEQAKSKPVVLAPTGVAALNVGGETIHSFFRFGIDITPEKVSKSRRSKENTAIYRKLDAIIIDEASMLRADLLDCVAIFLRKYGPRKGNAFGGVRMIFVGDLYQLPPVVKSDEREIFRTLYETPYFFSAHAFKQVPPQIIELQKVYRQTDEDFVDLLNQVRKNTLAEEGLQRLNQRTQPGFEPEKDELYISLTTTNRNADRINEEKLSSLPGKTVVSFAEISGELEPSSYPTGIELSIKPGARIMLLNNDENRRWVNGSLGEVVSIGTDSDKQPRLVVRLDECEETVSVERHAWSVIRFMLHEGVIATETVGTFTQLPLRLAWAVTIHKSQGKTFDRIILDLERGAFASGQTYVALSRCRSFEGIVLRRPVKPGSIRTDWRVQKFLTAYAYRDSEAAMPLEEKIEVIRGAIEAGQRLSIKYLKPDDTESRRVIQPFEVGEKFYKEKGFLAVTGYCEMRRAERNFRVDRILELEVVEPGE